MGVLVRAVGETDRMLLGHRMSRGSQPYRQAGGRQPGPSLDAMLRGRSSMGNPMDVQRRAQKKVKPKRDLAAWLLEP